LEIICSVKLLLTEDLCAVQKEVFSIAWHMFEMPDTFTTDKLNFSSERMLQKDYYRKGLVEEKISSQVSKDLTPR
jgi:hypothetical protein